MFLPYVKVILSVNSKLLEAFILGSDVNSATAFTLIAPVPRLENEEGDVKCSSIY